MNKIFKFLLLFLLFNPFSSFGNETPVDNKQSTIQEQKNNQNNKSASNIKNNLVNNNDIILSPNTDIYYSKFNSFMLGNNVIKVIRQALELGINKKNIEKKQDGISENVEENISTDIGNIYLKSIIFLSDNFWSVWINDKKITNNTNNNKENEFIIKEINSNKATILLKVNKTKWSYINSANMISEKEYSINEDDQVEFLFTLSPNQSFIASENKIIDGKYKNEEETLVNSIIDPSNNFDLDKLFEDINITDALK